MESTPQKERTVSIPEQVNRLRAAQEIAAVVRRTGVDPALIRERVEAASDSRPAGHRPAGDATWALVDVLYEDRSEEDLLVAGLKRLASHLPPAGVEV
jgi:hypothetical protein